MSLERVLNNILYNINQLSIIIAQSTIGMKRIFKSQLLKDLHIQEVIKLIRDDEKEKKKNEV